jgi:hypothetical protein
MSHRFLTSMTTLAATIALALPVTGQSASNPKPAAKATASKSTYTAPKLPWGDPDLEGIWPGNMGVPMQRPANLKDKAVISDEEFAKRVEQAKKQAQADSQEFTTSDTRVGIGPPSYWTERGKPTKRTSLIVDPPDGKLPPLTAEEEALRKVARGGRGFTGEWRGEANEPADMNLYYRCITRGLLGSIIPVVYNNGNQIVQGPGYVVFRNEMIHEARVIPLDGRPHVSKDIRGYLGDSRGHWEGSTLVVETTNFTDQDAIGSNGAGYPGDPGHHSADMKLIEKFTRVAPDQLNYEATVVDPKTWTKPYTLLIELKQEKNYQFLEYACHEGNYAMKDILSGTRADEARGIDTKAEATQGGRRGGGEQ